MSVNKLSRFLLLQSSALALLTYATAANAQDVSGASAPDNSQNSDDDIVVTALKRGESLQDTAAVVTAFNEEAIESIGVNSLRDFSKLVPNLLLVETQGSNFAFVNIRGISQFRNTDPSVAVVIDGVLNTTGNGLSQELFDVQQIEVLKGPQGALYGRNAIGGAIIISTAKPGNEFEGSVKVGFGNGDSGRAQAQLSGPLIEDELFARVAFNYYNDDGFRKNVTTGGNGDASQNFSARGRLIWEPTDRFTADLRGSYSADRANAGGFIDVSPIFHETAPGSGISVGQLIGVFAPNGPQVAEGPTTGGVSGCLPGNCPGLGEPGQALNIGNFNTTGVPLQTNLNGIDHRDIYAASLLMTYEFDFATLTSVTAYDRLTQFAVVEQPPRNAGAGQKNNQFRFSESWSQEIRLTSPSSQRLRWSALAYAVQTDTALTAATLRDKDGRDTLNDLVRLDPFAAPDGVCVGNPFPVGGPNDNQGNCLQGFIGDTSDNFAYAFSGEVSYDLFDNLEVIVSGRWDHEKRDSTVITPNSLTPQALIDNGAPLFGEERSVTFSSFQPKATLKWKPTSNLLTYVTYAEGFRSGGFNQPGIEALANFNRPISPLPIVEGVFDIFDKQTTSGFEVGTKFNTFDRKLTVNLAGFHTIAKNSPTFTAITIGTNLSQVILPIDRIRLYGAELDAAWRVTNSLQFTFGGAFTNSRITDHVADPTLIGNDAPTTPDYTINLGVNYDKRVQFGDIDGKVFFRGDYQRIGPMFDVAGNFSQRDEIDLVNIRLGFETDSGLRIEGWSKNLTNEDYFAEIFNPGGFGFPAKLRQWGVEVTKKF